MSQRLVIPLHHAAMQGDGGWAQVIAANMLQIENITLLIYITTIIGKKDSLHMEKNNKIYQ